MRLEGIYINNTKSTLYLSGEFEKFHQGEGKKTLGRIVKNVYVGDFPVDKLKIGDELEIYFGEPVTTKNGAAYAQVKKIEVVKQS